MVVELHAIILVPILNTHIITTTYISTNHTQDNFEDASTQSTVLHEIIYIFKFEYDFWSISWDITNWNHDPSSLFRNMPPSIFPSLPPPPPFASNTYVGGQGCVLHAMILAAGFQSCIHISSSTGDRYIVSTQCDIDC